MFQRCLSKIILIQQPLLISSIAFFSVSKGNLEQKAIVNDKQINLQVYFDGISKEYQYNRAPVVRKNAFIFGEDSLYISANKRSFGVADGVGGWADLGVDASNFSSTLMFHCKEFTEICEKKKSTCTPLDILSFAYNSIQKKADNQLIGSSTACIACFDNETNVLHSANLGDSGFVVIRNFKIVHTSKQQHHYFNAPFQLAYYPKMKNQQSYFNDKPNSASIDSFQLEKGDFIVMGTDGLWDNLKETDLIHLLSKIEKDFSEKKLNQVTKEIVNYTKGLALNPTYDSPFSLAAKKNGLKYIGGKPDDITIILAYAA